MDEIADRVARERTNAAHDICEPGGVSSWGRRGIGSVNLVGRPFRAVCGQKPHLLHFAKGSFYVPRNCLLRALSTLGRSLAAISFHGVLTVRSFHGVIFSRCDLFTV